MISPYHKSFETLLEELLTDYQGQAYYDADGTLQQFDISQGTMTFIKSACLASALWGVHQAIAWTGEQIFPDTASAENVARHAWLRGLTPTANETTSELLARLLDDLRRPPAGGNRYDYVKWALACDGVAAAWCYPCARGNGTVDVLVAIRDGADGATVRAAVLAYLEEMRPVGMALTPVAVSSPTVDLQDVTLSNVNGADTVLIAADIRTLLNALDPDQTLYRAQLAAIAVNHGALNPTITTPAADVTPTTHHMIRPGTVIVNA